MRSMGGGSGNSGGGRVSQECVGTRNIVNEVNEAGERMLKLSSRDGTTVQVIL